MNRNIVSFINPNYQSPYVPVKVLAIHFFTSDLIKVPFQIGVHENSMSRTITFSRGQRFFTRRCFAKLQTNRSTISSHYLKRIKTFLCSASRWNQFLGLSFYCSIVTAAAQQPPGLLASNYLLKDGCHCCVVFYEEKYGPRINGFATETIDSAGKKLDNQFS